MPAIRHGMARCAAALCATFVASLALAEIPLVAPEAVGFSAERLAVLDERMQALIDAERTAGIITLIARNGRIAHLQAYGHADREAGIELTTDHLFRLYSMTKPVASVALLMLYEEGAFELDDPLARHIPGFADIEVYAGTGDDGEPVYEAPRRAPTIRDVFRHTAGFSYGFGPSPVDDAYQAANISYAAAGSLAAFVEGLATVPLAYHPGERWVYSVSHDVQAYLVEHFSGMPFDEFCRTRIFTPLGMSDATFGVPEHDVERFTANYEATDEAGLRKIEGRDGRGVDPTPNPQGDYGRHTEMPFGGSSMSSTVMDYLRFAQMLVDGGELDGVRLLDEQTVELMRTDHLPEGVSAMGGAGYGLGVSVRREVPDGLGSVGQFGWAGAAGTWFTVDPEKDVVLLFMTQSMGGGGLSSEFETLAYRAFVGD